MFCMSIHENLKLARKKTNLTQQQVADSIGISRQAISQWESGKSTPDVETLQLLCKLYNITPNELLIESENLPKAINSNINSTGFKKKETKFEVLCACIIMIMMSQFAFIGIITVFVFLFWMKRNKQKNIILYILSIACFVISLYNTYNIIQYYFLDTFTYSITPK